MKSKLGTALGVRRAVVVALAAAMLVVPLAGTASAAPGDPIIINIDHNIIGGGGEIHFLTSVDVPDYAVGEQCLLQAQADNNSSVHLNNDFIVTSGSSEVTIPNVERAQGAVTNGDGPLTLGTTIDVSLFLGSSDEVFSGGFVITCSFPTPPPGEIIVVKEVTDGSDTQQAFNFTASYDADGFALSDGQQNASGDLAPGTYSVAESVPAGWSLVGATCDDQSPVSAIDLQAGETVTCTFVNDEQPEPPPGQIVVVKQVVDGSDTSQSFDFAASYDADGFSLSDGQQNSSGDLAPGTYSVAESVPAGWSLVGATCDDQSPVAAIDLQAGETVTCTFVNLQDQVEASIVVTVGTACITEGDGQQAVLDVTMSVDGGATVVIRDSNGAVVGTFTDSGTLDVVQNATYTWEATPSAGFVFPPGSETSGLLTVPPCDEVLASIVVSVGASCVQTSSGAEARINVNVSVADGATVVVTDSDGDVVGTFTDDGSVAAQTSSTYSWAATPSEGFEFPAGSATSGAVTTANCVDNLPLTGFGSGPLAVIAALLLATGLSLVVSQRTRGRHTN